MKRIQGATIGECIYCSSRNFLTNEHVVPLGLGGNIILRAATCEECRKKTHKFEDKALAGMLGPLRHGRDFPSRRRKERAKGVWVVLHKNGEDRRIRVPPSDLPKRSFALPDFAFVAPMFMPTQVREWYSQSSPLPTLEVSIAEPDISFQMEKYGGTFSMMAEPVSFSRMLAKIAHGIGVSVYGVNGFRPYLRELITNDSLDPSPYLYVGKEHFLPVQESWRNVDALSNYVSVNAFETQVDGRRIVGVNVAILPNIGTPRYGVAVGELGPESA